MRRIVVCSFLAALVGVVLDLAAGAAAQGAEPKSGRLRHVVLFKFKDGTTPEADQDHRRRLPSVAVEDPAGGRFEWGIDESPEQLAQGSTHCYFLTFRDKAIVTRI